MVDRLSVNSETKQSSHDQSVTVVSSGRLLASDTVQYYGNVRTEIKIVRVCC